MLQTENLDFLFPRPRLKLNNEVLNLQIRALLALHECSFLLGWPLRPMGLLLNVSKHIINIFDLRRGIISFEKKYTRFTKEIPQYAGQKYWMMVTIIQYIYDIHYSKCNNLLMTKMLILSAQLYTAISLINVRYVCSCSIKIL